MGRCCVRHERRRRSTRSSRRDDFRRPTLPSDSLGAKVAGALTRLAPAHYRLDLAPLRNVARADPVARDRVAKSERVEDKDCAAVKWAGHGFIPSKQEARARAFSSRLKETEGFDAG